MKLTLFLFLLCGSANFSFGESKDRVFVKDWMTGFETKKEALEWCKEVAESWNIVDDWEQYCEVHPTEVGGYTVVFYF